MVEDVDLNDFVNSLSRSSDGDSWWNNNSLKDFT
jgi:hypothetical protein